MIDHYSVLSLRLISLLPAQRLCNQIRALKMILSTFLAYSLMDCKNILRKNEELTTGGTLSQPAAIAALAHSSLPRIGKIDVPRI